MNLEVEHVGSDADLYIFKNPDAFEDGWWTIKRMQGVLCILIRYCQGLMVAKIHERCNCNFRMEY